MENIERDFQVAVALFAEDNALQLWVNSKSGLRPILPAGLGAGGDTLDLGVTAEN